MSWRSESNGETRTFCAWCAATAAVLLALHQRHFILMLSDPSSFVAMTQHRCGLALLATTSWAMVETVAVCCERWRDAEVRERPEQHSKRTSSRIR